MRKPTGYGVIGYGNMITNEPRMSAYAEALRRAVTPGCTVVDIGAGPGAFALLACQYGAGRVIAVEPDESIWLARALAEANGYADRIEFFQGLSSDLELPGGADVIVSDIRGILPLFQAHIPAIADARTRLLKPGGIMIPMRDTLRIAAVSAPKAHASRAEPWLRNKFGLDLQAGYGFVANSWTKERLKPEDLLTPIADLAVLDYRNISQPNLSASASLTADRAGVAHGLLIWFDTELAEGIGYSNAPGEPELVYGQSFFPLEQPLTLAPGDRIEADIRADLINGDYTWSWASRFFPAGSDTPQARFRQSSFLSVVTSPATLARNAEDHVPAAKRAHAIDSLCLSLIDGEASLRAIADRLEEQFPGAFVSPKAALDHVARLAGRYHHLRD